MFDSLHIKGFRAFQDLQLHGLGSVNLLVGTNNIGKTTALEAIKIRCSGTGAIWELVKLLDSRQEIERELSEEGEPHLAWNLRRLFYCESNGGGQPASQLFSIGPVDTPESTLTLELAWVRQIQDEVGGIRRQVVKEISGFGNDQDVFEGVVVSFGDSYRRIHMPERIFRYRPSRPGIADGDIGTVNCHYLPARGFGENEIGELWDKVVLTDLESDVLDALRIIAPAIERISLIESARRRLIESGLGRRSRTALVRRSGSQNPEPLKSLGDGMNRIFEMALGLANAKGGILLIDEVENGIHYSVQQELWLFIFEVASRLRSQVFATTHSWDCIEAFQKAASSHPAEGALIRLYRHENNIHANTFDEHRLEILTRESIEVR